MIDIRGNQIPPEHVATPLLQDTLLRALHVLKSFVLNGNATAILGSSQTGGVAKTSQQHQDPKFYSSMDQPPLGPRGYIDLTPVFEVWGVPLAIFTKDKLHYYEIFRKMDPP